MAIPSSSSSPEALPPWTRGEPSEARRPLHGRRLRGTRFATRLTQILLGVALGALALYPEASELGNAPARLRLSMRAVFFLGASWLILDGLAALARATGLVPGLPGAETREQELRDTTTLGTGLGQELLLGALLVASLPAQAWLLDAPWELRAAFGEVHGWRMVLAGVGIADLLAIGWLHRRLRAYGERSRSGRLRARLAPGVAARPGEKLSGRIWVPTPSRSRRVLLTLRYVEERFEERSWGRGRESYRWWIVVGDETYAETLLLELPDHQGAGPVDRDFTFVIPTSPPRPHRPWGSTPAYWELELQGGGQRAIFTLP